MNKRLILIIVIGILAIGNAYFISRNYILSRNLTAVSSEASSFETNKKVLNFSQLFVDLVLNSKSEIDFDTRLRLENAVRDIKDSEILNQWNKFVNSATESQAQEEVKSLLTLLIKKIQ